MNLIVCVDKNNGIGKNNTIPWNLRTDMKHFAKVTKNSIIIMGGNTWKSINSKPLKNRINLILSKTMTNDNNYENTFFFTSFVLLHKFLENIQSNKEIYAIGGKSIYEYFLKKNLINKIYMTKIDYDFNCDVFFPDIDLTNKYKITYKSNQIIDNDIKFIFCIYNVIS